VSRAIGWTITLVVALSVTFVLGPLWGIVAGVVVYSVLSRWMRNKNAIVGRSAVGSVGGKRSTMSDLDAGAWYNVDSIRQIHDPPDRQP